MVVPLSPTRILSAIATETRDALPLEAQARLRKLIMLDEVVCAQHLFKKVDSVFRGNTYLEVALCAREALCDVVVIAPSSPMLGRTSVDGVMSIKDIAGNKTVAVFDGLIGEDMSPRLVRRGMGVPAIAGAMQTQCSGGRPVFYCDAVSEEDLQDVVEAALLLGGRILWIGSAGLAHALAKKLAPPYESLLPRESVQGSVLFFIGSNHEVTRKQLKALQSRMAREAYDIRDTLGTYRAKLRYEVIQLDPGRSVEADVLRAVESFKSETVGCLMMTGGDTAMLVCRALGVHSLRLHDEFAPGLPCATIEGGIFDGVSAILKSGGFGDEDVLCRIALAFSARPEVIQ